MRRFGIFERDEFTCVYCGYSSIEDGAELEADHIVPVALGGKNVASNMATACWRCNQEKSARSIKQVKKILNLIERRNQETGIDPSEQYHPSRWPKNVIGIEQKRRNQMLLRSLKRYRQLGWYDEPLASQ